LLGYSIIRHNFAVCRGRICRTIPLRVRLDVPLKFSKSQRQILRRNADLEVRCAPIQITPEKEMLFLQHTQRFRDQQPLTIYSFLHSEAHIIPVAGLEYSVFDGKKLIASSFFHLGDKTVSGTYCFFDPQYSKRSLGTFTMLLELQRAQEMGKAFYYHGYCYDVPSQFDYKLNFHNLEALNWKSNAWTPQPRVSVGQWEAQINE
jgi:arginine-tRNA-protein transferase